MPYTITDTNGKTLYLVILASGATCYMNARARREYQARQNNS